MALTKQQKRENKIDRFEQKFKTLSIGKVFNEKDIGLAVIFQKLVRIAAADRNGMCHCVTCGAVGHWKNMHGGHFVSRNNKATIIDPKNVHVQCVTCNLWGNGREGMYRKFMLAKYGADVVEELESRKIPSNHTWNRRELAEKKYDMLLEIAKHQKRLDTNN